MLATFNQYIGSYPVGFGALGALASAGVDYYASVQTDLANCLEWQEIERKRNAEWGDRLIKQMNDLDSGKSEEEVGNTREDLDYYFYHSLRRAMFWNAHYCNERENAAKTFTATSIAPYLPAIRDYSNKLALAALAVKLATGGFHRWRSGV